MTCAFAVRGALKKFPGVESVDVSLNQGLATVKLKPGNTVETPQFWETIRRNGFTPKETKVTLRGEVTTAGKLQLKVLGTGEAHDLAPDPKSPQALDELKRQAGKRVVVQGALTPLKDPKAPVPLVVQSFQADK